MKKLLAVGPIPPPINGMSKAFALSAAGLKAKGWNVDVVNVADHSHRRRSAFTLERAGGVARILVAGWARLRRCDVLYVAISQSRLGFLKDSALLVPAALLGKRTVLHLHGADFRNFYEAQPYLAQKVIQGVLQNAWKIIVLTPGMESDFDMVPGWQEKVEVVANASEMPIGGARLAPERQLHVLYLSNLLVEKGFLDVLDGALELSRRLPEWRLKLDFAGAFQLGRDEYRSIEALKREFEERVAAAPANLSVYWHGVVDGQKKRALLQDSDVFVLPTYITEGQPISVLEALAAGLPVIATAQRGIVASLPESFRELLVPPKSPSVIADALMRLATEPALYEKLSRDGVQRAKQYTPEAHVNALDSVLRGSGPSSERPR